MAFKFKIAYTIDPKKIQPALDAGIINQGDLIIVNEDDTSGSLRFITNENQILTLGASQEQINESINTALEGTLDNKVSSVVDTALTWEEESK